MLDRMAGTRREYSGEYVTVYNRFMADIFSKKKRSSIMAAVKGKDSAIEKEVGTALKKIKVRMVKHSASLPGKPDFSSRKLKCVIFVDSCFWHGCSRHYSAPKSNAVFWRKKVTRNKQRDREINREYRQLGWKVVRVWQHDLGRKNSIRIENRLSTLMKE